MTYWEYVEELNAALSGVQRAQFGALVNELQAARSRGATVFTAGNGGSAAVASHFAGDALKACGLRAVCLTDNATALTAYANDVDYYESIAGPLSRLACTGDVLVLFSCSGTSRNILRAMSEAFHNPTMAVSVCCVFGDLKPGTPEIELENVDVLVRIPSLDYGIIEDAMSAICHAVIRELSKP